jgi:hypothetical protein
MQLVPETAVVLISTVGLMKVHCAVTDTGISIAIAATAKNANCFIRGVFDGNYPVKKDRFVELNSGVRKEVRVWSGADIPFLY